jgi:hypothetical protein
MGKVAENGRKVKALVFGRFSPLFQKSKKWQKMEEKLGLLLLCHLWLKITKTLEVYFAKGPTI